jgi:hypothetical protein
VPLGKLESDFSPVGQEEGSDDARGPSQPYEVEAAGGTVGEPAPELMPRGRVAGAGVGLGVGEANGNTGSLLYAGSGGDRRFTSKVALDNVTGKAVTSYLGRCGGGRGSAPASSGCP